MSGLGAAFTGFRLLGISKFLRGIPWQLWAALGALLALLFAWHLHTGWERAQFNAAYNAGWTKADTNWRAESAKAKAAQIAVNAAPAIKSKQIAETSNVESQAYYERGRRAGLDYAAAHLVRGTAGAPGSTSRGPDLPVADRPAGEHDGQGVAPDMVAVAPADFDLLVANSTRLAKVHQDAEQLIAAGIAAPAP